MHVKQLQVLIASVLLRSCTICLAGLSSVNGVTASNAAKTFQLLQVIAILMLSGRHTTVLLTLCNCINWASGHPDVLSQCTRRFLCQDREVCKVLDEWTPELQTRISKRSCSWSEVCAGKCSLVILPV